VEAHLYSGQIGWNPGGDRGGWRRRSMSGDGWQKSHTQDKTDYEENKKDQGKVRGSQRSLARRTEQHRLNLLHQSKMTKRMSVFMLVCMVFMISS
jgi:hypothetical protein